MGDEQADALEIALAAVDEFERNPGDWQQSKLHSMANLRTQIAIASELRALREILTGAFTLFVAELDANNDA